MGFFTLSYLFFLAFYLSRFHIYRYLEHFSNYISRYNQWRCHEFEGGGSMHWKVNYKELTTGKSSGQWKYSKNTNIWRKKLGGAWLPAHLVGPPLATTSLKLHSIHNAHIFKNIVIISVFNCRTQTPSLPAIYVDIFQMTFGYRQLFVYFHWPDDFHVVNSL